MKLLVKTAILILIGFAFFYQEVVTAQKRTETDTQPTHKLSGLVYSDYYYMISNHNEDLEGMYNWSHLMEIRQLYKQVYHI